VRNLLEQALAANFDDNTDPLYSAALAVGQDGRLAAEMAEWEEAALADGLDGAPAP